MRKMIFLVLIVLLASPSLALWGAPKDSPPRAGRDKMFERITRELKLTEEQKAQLQVDMEKDKKETGKNRSEIKKLVEQMKTELERDKPDRAQIHGLIKKIADKRTAMEIMRMDSLLKLRETLTPEQRTKFKEMARPKRRRWR